MRGRAVTRRDVPKDYVPLYNAAIDQGWTVELAGKRNSHLRWINPQGESVYSGSTPSCNGTGIIRIIAKLRRAGLEY